MIMVPKFFRMATIYGSMNAFDWLDLMVASSASNKVR
jgi:hypothetical protein